MKTPEYGMSSSMLCGGHGWPCNERTVKYMPNSAAKNMSSLDSHTIVPTLTMLGRDKDACRGARSAADAVATRAIMSMREPAAAPPPGAVTRASLVHL